MAIIRSPNQPRSGKTSSKDQNASETTTAPETIGTSATKTDMQPTTTSLFELPPNSPPAASVSVALDSSCPTGVGKDRALGVEKVHGKEDLSVSGTAGPSAISGMDTGVKKNGRKCIYVVGREVPNPKC